jgi:hypothetical protein
MGISADRPAIAIGEVTARNLFMFMSNSPDTDCPSCE